MGFYIFYKYIWSNGGVFHLHVCDAYVVNPPKVKGQTFIPANVYTAIKGKLTDGRPGLETDKCGRPDAEVDFEALDDGRSAWFGTFTDGRPTTNRITEWKTEGHLNTSNRWIGINEESFGWIGTSGNDETNANPVGTKRDIIARD